MAAAGVMEAGRTRRHACQRAHGGLVIGAQLPGEGGVKGDDGQAHGGRHVADGRVGGDHHVATGKHGAGLGKGKRRLLGGEVKVAGLAGHLQLAGGADEDHLDLEIHEAFNHRLEEVARVTARGGAGGKLHGHTLANLREAGGHGLDQLGARGKLQVAAGCQLNADALREKIDGVRGLRKRAELDLVFEVGVLVPLLPLADGQRIR